MNKYIITTVVESLTAVNGRILCSSQQYNNNNKKLTAGWRSKTCFEIISLLGALGIKSHAPCNTPATYMLETTALQYL